MLHRFTTFIAGNLPPNYGPVWSWALKKQLLKINKWTNELLPSVFLIQTSPLKHPLSFDLKIMELKDWYYKAECFADICSTVKHKNRREKATRDYILTNKMHKSKEGNDFNKHREWIIILRFLICTWYTVRYI